jgi:hypothetical protein
LYLPDKLCDYLGVKGYGSEFGFLLRSDNMEITGYFKQEGIELPEINLANQISIVSTDRSNNNNRQEITTQDLISLGIESIDKLKELLISNKALSSSFFHSSISFFDSLQYVQRIVNRAKERIKIYLETIGYDCTDAEEISPSVFAGIKKEGKRYIYCYQTF